MPDALPLDAACSGIITLDLRNRNLSAVLQDVEKEYLSHVMTEASGNKAGAARLAGISDDAFRAKLKRFTVRAIYRLA